MSIPIVNGAGDFVVSVATAYTLGFDDVERLRYATFPRIETDTGVLETIDQPLSVVFEALINKHGYQFGGKSAIGMAGYGGLVLIHYTFYRNKHNNNNNNHNNDRPAQKRDPIPANNNEFDCSC